MTKSPASHFYLAEVGLLGHQKRAEARLNHGVDQNFKVVVRTSDSKSSDFAGNHTIATSRIVRPEDLAGFAMERCYLYGVELNERTNLTNADLRGAQLQEAKMTRVTATRINLGRANGEKSEWIECDLRGANVNFMCFKDGSIAGSNFIGASMDSTNLNGTDVSDALLPLSVFTAKNLNKAKGLNDARFFWTYTPGYAIEIIGVRIDEHGLPYPAPKNNENHAFNNSASPCIHFEDVMARLLELSLIPGISNQYVAPFTFKKRDNQLTADI